MTRNPYCRIKETWKYTNTIMAFLRNCIPGIKNYLKKWEMGVMRERIKALKEVLNSKTEFNNWFLLEKIKMNSYKKNKDAPPALKRAFMLEDLLREMPIRIEDNERLAGTLDDIFATSYNLFKGGLEDFEGYCGYEDLYDEVKGKYPEEEIKEVKDFWMNEDFEKTMASLFNPTDKAAMDEGVFFVEPVTGHAIFDAPTVLAKGYGGILREVEEKLRECKDSEKKMFYEAVAISLKAAIAFSKRYSSLAFEMAEKESNAVRKEELANLGRALQNVPEKPASSFYEAVVSFWLTYVIMHIEQTPNPYAFSIGRIDQFFFPYYKKDRDEGKITYEDAVELIEELWLKFNVGNKVWDVSQNAAIGGVKEDGSDATNELTYILLEATDELAIPLPTLTVKIHEGTPELLFNKAMLLSSKGRGNPTIINDEVVIKSKMATGVSLEDARNSAIAGCQELVVQGAENARTTACWFSLPKCLELTLNRGRSMLTGRQLGIDSGDLDTLKTFEEFEKVYWQQVDHFIKVATENANKCDYTLAENRPVPFISAIMKDCIEKGRDFRKDGARYNFSGFLCHGVANTADAFAVIKKLIFEEKKTTFKELAEALKANWKGFEDLHKMVMEVPKYGNDDDYVDSMATSIAMRIAEKVPQYTNSYGGKFRPGFSTPSTHVLYGRKCAATPDGRYHRDNFAYGCGPMQGANRRGPTAVINSCVKFPHWMAYHGLSFNLSFPPSAVKGEEGIKRLGSIVKVYNKKGGRYIQFNIQDVETLRKAQKEPEKYRDLIVRVHGMSAYFVNLDPLIQEDIIRRVECGL